jgi:hypothetical protein
MSYVDVLEIKVDQVRCRGDGARGVGQGCGERERRSTPLRAAGIAAMLYSAREPPWHATSCVPPRAGVRACGPGVAVRVACRYRRASIMGVLCAPRCFHDSWSSLVSAAHGKIHR